MDQMRVATSFVENYLIHSLKLVLLAYQGLLICKAWGTRGYGLGNVEIDKAAINFLGFGCDLNYQI